MASTSLDGRGASGSLPVADFAEGLGCQRGERRSFCTRRTEMTRLADRMASLEEYICKEALLPGVATGRALALLYCKGKVR